MATSGSLIEVRAGFVALTDCATLVIASEKGFDRQCGISLALGREVSWANIRDKVDAGIYDCAHMLAPMPLAAALRLGRATEPIIVPFSLSLGGNTIVVSQALFGEMSTLDISATLRGGMAGATAIAKVIRDRQRRNAEPLTFGMVYPFSCHNYELRYWLAAAGIDPDNDLNVVVVPPPLLAESLRLGRVDGFCAGAPWSSVAVEAGLGQVVATKSELWRFAPEKVLGVRQTWASKEPDALNALIASLIAAARWLDEPSNLAEAAHILAKPHYVGVDEQLIAIALAGGPLRATDRPALADPDFMCFFRGHATFPWRSHALWLLGQMVRWGQARTPFDLREVAERVYRPDLYRAAVGPLGVEIPVTDYKSEGVGVTASGGFFAETAFEPASIMDYLARFPVRGSNVSLERFSALNGR